MLDIMSMVKNARYSEQLEYVINTLGGVTVLFLNFEADYQGFVDIDVLLSNGLVFSYYYTYGSCSGCDEWENRNLGSDEIEQIMIFESTRFSSLESYNNWALTVDSRSKLIAKKDLIELNFE
jgi:hypothetical protein